MVSKKIIELKNIEVRYKEKKSLFNFSEYIAIKDISFDVYKGEVLGIIGRNGAGKSTLLRLLAGIIRPDAGSLIHHTKSVSLMALAAGFDPNLSGRQNTIISGMLLGYRKSQIIGKIDTIKEFSELQDFFEKPTKSYSSGMRARLAFSIAMYVSPDVLLIDEVLGVGDASFKRKAENALVEKICTDITVVFVSHSEQQMKKLAQRVVWIDNGRVRKQGRPEDIFNEYNLNVSFSNFGLYVKKYILNDDYEVIVEIVSFDKQSNQLYLSFLITKKNFDAVNLISIKEGGSDNIVTSFEPKATPGYGRSKKNNINAMCCRFGKLSVSLGDTIVLEDNAEDNVTILELVVDVNEC